LPPPVLEKLRELNAELAEGDITQKGYEKKRAKLLGPYLSRGENRAVFGIHSSLQCIQNINIQLL